MNEGTLKQFDNELFIVHPTLVPSEISAALGLDAKIAHRVGDERKTPKGTSLSGIYEDTRWRHSRRFETPDQWFVEKVAELVEYLAFHKEFLRNLRATGGSAEIIIHLLGDGYFGDSISSKILTKLVDLELNFGIECYTTPQTK